MDNLETMRRERESFGRDGFIGPITLFTRAQCQVVLRHFRHGDPPTPLKWGKGQAASDRLIFDFATRPALLARLRLLLGNDILLWGASLIAREPNQIHPWHSDIESSAPGGGSVSVWIGSRLRQPPDAAWAREPQPGAAGGGAGGAGGIRPAAP